MNQNPYLATMAKKADKPSKKQGKPRVHRDLAGLEISINQFGEEYIRYKRDVPALVPRLF